MPTTIKPKVKVLDKKERQRRLELVLKLAANSYALVGVQNASTPYPGEDVTLGQVAADMEFGTYKTPARSFLRTPIDTMQEQFAPVQDRAINGMINGQLSIADALGSLGFFVANRIKNTIYRGIDPELEMITRKLKRTDRPNKGVSPTPDTPLMDTGRLVQSIGYEVFLGEAGGGD